MKAKQVGFQTACENEYVYVSSPEFERNLQVVFLYSVSGFPLTAILSQHFSLRC